MSTDAAHPPLRGIDSGRPAPADALARIMRGFSCVFWGIPFSVLLFAGAIDLRMPFAARVPAYVLGVFLIYCGIVYFQRAMLPGARWNSLVREMVFVLLIEVYLSPFVYWWRHMPHVPYYVANLLILMLCTAWGLFILNQLAGEIARSLRERFLSLQAQVCAWLALTIMCVPIGCALYYSVLAARSYGMAPVPGQRIGCAFGAASVYSLALMPFLITMLMAWRIKERCLLALQTRAHHASIDGANPV